MTFDLRYGTKEECNETAVMIKTKFENGTVVIVTAEVSYINLLYDAFKKNNILWSNGYNVIFFTLNELTAYSFQVYILLIIIFCRLKMYHLLLIIIMVMNMMEM